MSEFGRGVVNAGEAVYLNRSMSLSSNFGSAPVLDYLPGQPVRADHKVLDKAVC